MGGGEGEGEGEGEGGGNKCTNVGFIFEPPCLHFLLLVYWYLLVKFRKCTVTNFYRFKPTTQWD